MSADASPDSGNSTPKADQETSKPESSPQTTSQELEDGEHTEKEPMNPEDKAQEKSEDQGEEKEKEKREEKEEGEVSSAPPLPAEEAPPLPNEAPPGQEDDGWEPIWDSNVQAYYFYNRFTGVSQWENPRVPEASIGTPGAGEQAASSSRPVAGGYNPAIHGDYDPTAPYAQQYEQDRQAAAAAAAGNGYGAAGVVDPSQTYTATGAFNRFTGKWQPASLTPERFNDENKARRQMYAYFDVDAAANSHDGRSLKAERSARKLSKKELKAFQEKRRQRKEEKRRAWLRD
ncbi:hypothetical protein VTN77DRAFT_2708 [Rasamsonia byssochlamydoides]|uniref:uncharacterized protein n=1 Tax=Rasamsonia byssochlamydoides TaxID=89139 RepID=UPI003743876F